MEDHKEEFTIVKMCKVLKVSRSGYHQWIRRRNRSEWSEKTRKQKELEEAIVRSFQQSYETYGSPRVQRDLLDWGFEVSVRKVAKMMHALGLKASQPKKFIVTTDANHDSPVYPNVLKDKKVKADRPNQVWVADLTYIWTKESWLYQASIIDAYTKKNVGTAFATHMRKELPMEALQLAIDAEQPPPGLIHHSDRGSQYCSNDYRKLLASNKMLGSMSRKGNPYDNAIMESFFATLKKDWIYRQKYKTVTEAIQAIHHYLYAFYNTRRRHSALGYLSPKQYEQHYKESVT
ncbi:IS3 family transposase [Geomicrobium sp. JCM 19039]|uniref:IS3 family transposase n=1 Tax=Geomicrobium sp. JCM 19039 TaxID=1460636 RepID=UPI001EE68594|nr:IS3 family transposase [Geomicrobium sp. JCM 19039]